MAATIVVPAQLGRLDAEDVADPPNEAVEALVSPNSV